MKWENAPNSETALFVDKFIIIKQDIILIKTRLCELWAVSCELWAVSCELWADCTQWNFIVKKNIIIIKLFFVIVMTFSFPLFIFIYLQKIKNYTT